MWTYREGSDVTETPTNEPTVKRPPMTDIEHRALLLLTKHALEHGVPNTFHLWEFAARFADRMRFGRVFANPSPTLTAAFRELGWSVTYTAFDRTQGRAAETGGARVHVEEITPESTT